MRLVSRVSAAWGQRSTIWLSFDFEAESRLPENEGLGLRRASDFGFRRTVFDADGNRFDRGGLWIDLSVKWPEEAEQEWEKNRFVRFGMIGAGGEEAARVDHPTVSANMEPP